LEAGNCLPFSPHQRYHRFFKNGSKKCPQCRAKTIKKNGKRNGRQRWQCTQCKYQWINNKKNNWTPIYREYVLGKQTLQQLAERHKLSARTIRRKFDQLDFSKGKIEAEAINQPLNIVADATFFSRISGVLVARASSRNILWQEIRTETNSAWEAFLLRLKTSGIQARSFTIDGRRGVIKLIQNLFPGAPIQLCQFHQVAIITRYTTRNPQTECGIELRKLALQLTKMDREQFTKEFCELQNEFSDFLKERNENGQFLHRRLRSAFRSLRTNLPFPFYLERLSGVGYSEYD